MILTIEDLLSSPVILSAVIDRVYQTEKDKIYWKGYLDFEETKSRLFKTYIGTVTGVVMGSVIDRNSQKPLRDRKTMGSGVGEVAALGNSYQFDNERLDIINELIVKYNSAGKNKKTVLNQIIEFLTDDIRECTLAPHKRMDYVVGQLRSTGKANVKIADNPQGIEMIDLELPVIKHNPTTGDKDKFIAYLRGVAEEMKTKVGNFSIMEMTRKTFNNRIVTSSEFQGTYKGIFGSSEIAISGGLITENMANQLFTGIGLPPVKLVEEYVIKEDGKTVNTFEDDKIAFLPQGKLGKMMWHKPFESTDPVPGKTYTELEGGHFIATCRTNEGRFTEYMTEWMPNFKAPNKIAIIDTSKLG